jgi:hypothetical protein
MRTVLQHCPSCDEERDFETPPCPDGHGAECPELVCVQCGTTLLAGVIGCRPGRPAAFGTAA